MARPSKPDKPNWKNTKSELPSIDRLPEFAQEEWSRLSPFLLKAARVSKIDKQSLVTYCLTYDSFARTFTTSFAEPWAELFSDGPKCQVVHWAIPPLIRYAKSIYRLAGQFGMTARTRDLNGSHGNRMSTAEKKMTGNRSKVAEHKLDDHTLPLIGKWSTSDTACPSWMPTRAQAEYYEIAKVLERFNMFTPLDRTTLSVGCAMYELLLRATEQLKELTTEVVKVEKVEDEWEETIYLKEHPLHSVITNITEFLHIVWKDYGMTARYRKIFEGEEAPEKTVPIIFKPRVAR